MSWDIPADWLRVNACPWQRVKCGISGRRYPAILAWYERATFWTRCGYWLKEERWTARHWQRVRRGIRDTMGVLLLEGEHEGLAIYERMFIGENRVRPCTWTRRRKCPRVRAGMLAWSVD